MPALLRRRPELEPGDRVFIDAFQSLTQARSYHMSGPNPLAISEIESYCRLAGLSRSPPFRRLFLYLVQKLDGTYMEYTLDSRAARAKAQAQERAQKKGGAGAAINKRAGLA